MIREYLSFEEARLYVRGLGFTKKVDYTDWVKTGYKPRNIPYKPEMIYKDEWISWGDWLGTGKKKVLKGKLLPFDEARDFVHNLQPRLNSIEDWEAWVAEGKRPCFIPVQPYKIYKDRGWMSWQDWLGTGESCPLPADCLNGKSFESLRVIGISHRDEEGAYIYNCECICTNVITVIRENLLSKNTTSCGCREGRDNRTGYAKALSSWRSMKARCLNKNHKQWKDYGGRGIEICSQWLDSFDNFLTDMGEPPIDMDMPTIERLDVNKNYEPSNCTWLSLREQYKNKRSSYET